MNDHHHKSLGTEYYIGMSNSGRASVKQRNLFMLERYSGLGSNLKDFVLYLFLNISKGK